MILLRAGPLWGGLERERESNKRAHGSLLPEDRRRPGRSQLVRTGRPRRMDMLRTRVEAVFKLEGDGLSDLAGEEQTSAC